MSESRLIELFDVETRALAYRDGKRIDQRQLRIEARSRDPRVLLAELEARNPSRLDGRVALKELEEKRNRWQQ